WILFGHIDHGITELIIGGLSKLQQAHNGDITLKRYVDLWHMHGVARDGNVQFIAVTTDMELDDGTLRPANFAHRIIETQTRERNPIRLQNLIIGLQSCLECRRTRQRRNDGQDSFFLFYGSADSRYFTLNLVLEILG